MLLPFLLATTALTGLLAASDGPAFGRTPRCVELAGRPLDRYPWFEYTQSFNVGENVALGFDTALHGPVPTHPIDLYVVEHRSPSEWETDARLVDVSGAARTVTLPKQGGVRARSLKLDHGTLAGGVGTQPAAGYDIVVDVNRNGVLDGADLLDGFGVAGFHVVVDIVQRGPLTVTEGRFDGGDLLRQVFYYPVGVSELGELPLVVISHGVGQLLDWYDAIGLHLASWGIVVLSHESGAAAGIETSAAVTINNIDAFLSTLGELAGGDLLGHIDTSRIILMGQGRGAEGITRAYDHLFDGTIKSNQFGVDDIKLISAMSPTAFLRRTESDPHAVPYHIWVGSSDTDVHGCSVCGPCQSFRLFERARQARASVVVQGAGNDSFNSGPNNAGGAGPCQNIRTRVERMQKPYLLALISHFVLEQPWAAEYLWKQYESFHAVSAPNHPCMVVTHTLRAGRNAGAVVLDDFQRNSGNPFLSSSDTLVAFDVDDQFGGRLDDTTLDFTSLATDPMNGMTQGHGGDRAFGTVFTFAGDAFYSVGVPLGANDFTNFEFLSFRAAQATRHAGTIGQFGDLTFDVQLIDAAGNTSTINIGAYGGGIEEPYQRTGCGSGVGWLNEFETVRMRLTDFLRDDSPLNLEKIRDVVFLFGPSHGSLFGRLGLDDIQLEPKLVGFNQRMAGQ